MRKRSDKNGTRFRGVKTEEILNRNIFPYTRWFKYDRDDLCVNKSQFVPVIFEPPCIYTYRKLDWQITEGSN
jgi:hypothetical protein